MANISISLDQVKKMCYNGSIKRIKMFNLNEFILNKGELIAIKQNVSKSTIKRDGRK